MHHLTGSRLPHWISALTLVVAIPLSGCGNPDSPTTTGTGSTGNSSSSGASCPPDAAPAQQILAIPEARAVAALADSLYIIAPEPMFGDSSLYKLAIGSDKATLIDLVGSARTLVTEGEQLYFVAGRTMNRGSDVLFTGPDGVDYYEVALDETSYYILTFENDTTTAAVVRAPRSGGEPTPMATLPLGAGRAIAADGSAVYVLHQDITVQSSASRIFRIPLDGSPRTTVATDILPDGFAVDATSLYYFRLNPSSAVFELVKSVKTGGPATVLLSDLQGPIQVLVDDDQVYVLESGKTTGEGRVQRISRNGDCGQVLATGQNIEPALYTHSNLATNATDVFWATKDGIGRATK